MRPSSGRIDIAANAKKLDVDNRISLRIYFRIADNLLRQATIFRNEKNIIDLYVMLLRFSREYASSPQSKKSLLKKQLIIALNELEALNPAVKQKIKEHERKPMYQVIGWNHNDRPNENHSLSSSVQWPLINAPSPINSQVVKATQIFSRGAYGGLNAQQNVYTIPVEEKFHKLSVSFPRPKEETLLRHSILGPNGLCRQWQPPVSDKGVRYPSNIDTTPVEIPRLQQVMAMEDGVAANKDESTVDCEKPILQPTIEPSSDSSQKPQDDEKPMISFEEPDVPETVIVKQPSPPPVLAEVQDLIPSEPPLKTEKLDTMDSSLQDSLLQSESPMELHISTSMMDTFLRLAKSNTAKNLETCGILAGSLKNRKFYITALIIPKQESTSDTVMLPEAVAIVMAPRDRTKTHGIFRLTTPGGMSVIRHCDRRGFHSHEQPADGGPLYKQCTDVYINPKLKFDVIDLR
uniref:AMSH-like ubiquitin thioesterase 1 n=1 Tax=Chenopodium quinoa TaxID=63459 RepID=A0A803MRB2_CHEQI